MSAVTKLNQLHMYNNPCIACGSLRGISLCGGTTGLCDYWVVCLYVPDIRDADMGINCSLGVLIYLR